MLHSIEADTQATRHRRSYVVAGNPWQRSFNCSQQASTFNVTDFAKTHPASINFAWFN
jgi:hypothetical protein